ncbi:PRC-barrel domain protein [Pirellulimonas nuda]|uniref:PRC-barrel domain protein n=1 Tax=Pirellulimonas nuda TaxID=2528009 RepID=A0A518D705_9BACT|nr:PRC-barrel domain-containing protein [Pirellulimonas nuda]QDU87268.1 PRC-barrel domain protein [Pirellulimonas nuda]
MTRNLIAALALVLTPAMAMAQVTVDAPGTRVQVGNNRDGRTAQRGQTVRISELMGANVKNNADEDLGSIEDIVLNADNGRVQYAAVSMGGFLGLGDKLFAVPWSAIRHQTVDGEHVLVLNVVKEQFENAEGFDQDNWPDMASPQWRTTNDALYGVDANRPVRNRNRDRE